MGKDAKGGGGKGKGKQASGGSDEASASKGKGKAGKAADGLGTCTYVKGMCVSLILVFLYVIIQTLRRLCSKNSMEMLS